MGTGRGLAWQARLLSRGMTVVGIVFAVFVWWYFTSSGTAPVDARAYWEADPVNLYPRGREVLASGYLYTPVFELFFAPFRMLPFDVFAAVWRGLILAAVVYLAGPLTVPVLLTMPVASEVNAGNIQVFLALAVYLGFRRPGTWAFVLLTKVTPGIGLVWFALRREWRALAEVAAVTGVLVLVSVLTNPDAWRGYSLLLSENPAPAPPPWNLSLWQRLPAAVAILVLGAWRGWRWTVPIGATIALPVFYTISPSMLVGVLPFVRRELWRRFVGSRSTVLEPPPAVAEVPVAPAR